MNNIYKTIAVTLTAFSVCAVLASTDDIPDLKIGFFSEMDLAGWKEKSFNGNTEYKIRSVDGYKFLQASADMSASALYKRVKIDLNKTPILNWSWMINERLPVLTEEVKNGDDYSARVYVIVKRGLAPWKSNALNYVWSSRTSKNAWPNAFTSKAIMIPLRYQKDFENEWHSEKVNVKEDFKKYFGLDVDHIDGVAIMTDTDNSRLSASASYGDIDFSMM